MTSHTQFWGMFEPLTSGYATDGNTALIIKIFKSLSFNVTYLNVFYLEFSNNCLISNNGGEKPNLDGAFVQFCSILSPHLHLD